MAKQPKSKTPAAPADAAVDALLDEDEEPTPATAPMPTPPEIAAQVPAWPDQGAAAKSVRQPGAAVRYRVKANKVLSLSGYITHLSAGDIVSESSYGPIGMQRIIEAGVQLEELPD